MDTSNKNAKTRSRFYNILNGFLYGDLYPALIAAWVIVCFAFDIQTVGLLVLIAIACVIFIFKKDVLPVVPLFLYFLFLIKDYNLLLGVQYVVAYSLLAFSVIFHFIRFRDKFYSGQLLFPMILLSLAMILGGNFSVFRNKFIEGLTQVLTVGPLLIIIYSVFLNGIKFSDMPKDFSVKDYFARVFIISGIILGSELFLSFYVINGVLPEGQIPVLWGNTNTLATVITVCVPFCFYMIYKTGNTLCWFTVLIFFLLSLLRAQSDGCIGITFFTLPFLAAFTYTKTSPRVKKQLLNLLEISVIVASAVGIYFSLNYSTEEIFEFILTRTDDSSRCNLYDFAITLFKKHPIFGAGVGISDDTLFIPDDLKLKNFNFHSTVFHTMGTMGVFGIITYIIYYFCRYRILVVKNTAFSAYVYFSLTMFIAYGLIDTCEFNVIPLLSYITVTLLIAEKCRFLPQKDNLPLKTVK